MSDTGSPGSTPKSGEKRKWASNGAPLRDEFSTKTLDVLAKRVGVRCSNPGCRKLTTGPRSDAGRIVCIGVGAHITAASPGGKRYDAALTPKQRAAEDNGIWLCQNDAKLVDNDEARYTVALLRAWKRKAEEAARTELEGTAERLPEDAAELVLFVGNVEIGAGRTIRAETYGYDSSGNCDRHEYTLSVNVRNLGNERLSGYHVDLEFPLRPLEHPEAHAAYVRDRSTTGRAFFRASGTAAPELFPGDGAVIITLPYHMDNEMFWQRSGRGEHVYAQLVRVTLYRRDLPPFAIEKAFKDFTNF